MNVQIILQILCLGAVVLSGPIIIGVLSTNKGSL